VAGLGGDFWFWAGLHAVKKMTSSRGTEGSNHFRWARQPKFRCRLIQINKKSSAARKGEGQGFLACPPIVAGV